MDLDSPQKFGGWTPDATQAWLVVATSTTTLIVDLLTGPVLPIPGLKYALGVPFVVLFGVWAAVGFALGGVFADLLAGTLGPVLLTRFGADVLFGLLGLVGWNGRPIPFTTVDARLVYGVAAYLASSLLGSLGSIALLLTTTPLLMAHSIVPAVPTLLVDRLLLVLVLGPLLLLGLASATAVGRSSDRHVPLLARVGTWTASTRRWPRISTQRRIAVGAVILAWLVGGYVLGLINQDVAALPKARAQFVGYLPALLEPLGILVVDHYYAIVQACISVAGTALLAVVALGDGGNPW